MKRKWNKRIEDEEQKRTKHKMTPVELLLDTALITVHGGLIKHKKTMHRSNSETERITDKIQLTINDFSGSRRFSSVFPEEAYNTSFLDEGLAHHSRSHKAGKLLGFQSCESEKNLDNTNLDKNVEIQLLKSCGRGGTVSRSVTPCVKPRAFPTVWKHGKRRRKIENGVFSNPSPFSPPNEVGCWNTTTTTPVCGWSSS